MPNTYVIQSVSHIGDAATVTGTVNGTPVTASFSFSSLGTFASVALAQTFLINLMLAAFNAITPASTAVYNGTLVQ
jgi:hypothetical protein